MGLGVSGWVGLGSGWEVGTAYGRVGMAAGMAAAGEDMHAMLPTPFFLQPPADHCNHPITYRPPLSPPQEYTAKLAAVQGKGDEYEAAAAQVGRWGRCCVEA